MTSVVEAPERIPERIPERMFLGRGWPMFCVLLEMSPNG